MNNWTVFKIIKKNDRILLKKIIMKNQIRKIKWVTTKTEI
jgi:hypothetical protein